MHVALGGRRMSSRNDEVSKLPDEYLDKIASAVGLDWRLEGEDATEEAALARQRRRVRRALRYIAKEDAARERGLHPKEAKAR